MVIPFDEYDFENDEKYATYLKNVELTGAPEDQPALLKRLQAKCQERGQMQDPDFVPAAAQPAPQDKAPEQPHWSQTEPPPNASTQSSARPPATEEPAATQAPRGPTPAQTNAAPKSLLPGLNALIQAAMFILAFVFLASYVMQNRSLNLTTYRIFLQAALTSHVLRLVVTVGYPKIWPFNWPELQQWIARVSGTSDAHYASVCFMLASQPPTLAVMASPAIFAGLRLAAYVRKNFPGIFSFAVPLCDKISARREQAFYGMAVMDLSLLGVVIGRAFTQRAVLLPFVYINMLRHRYKSPVSAKYHQAVWGVLVGYVQPFLKHMPAPVHTGVGYLTRWFTGRTV